jgi:hypothetical protein
VKRSRYNVRDERARSRYLPIFLENRETWPGGECGEGEDGEARSMRKWNWKKRKRQRWDRCGLIYQRVALYNSECTRVVPAVPYWPVFRATHRADTAYASSVRPPLKH